MMRRALLVACGLFALTPMTVAIAQNARVEGGVQWIAGTKMSLIPRTGGPRSASILDAYLSSSTWASRRGIRSG